MLTIDATLRGAVTGSGDERTINLDPAFGGLPETAHGGSVLALFDALASRRGPRTVRGRYLRRVPLGVPLTLTLSRDADVLGCRVAERTGTMLVDGTVAPADASACERALAESITAPDRHASPLPISLTCLACGLENPLGLRARLTFDATTVGTAWTPRPEFRTPDGALSPIVLTTLLDEAAFWLGALASGESGMTTELAVTLHGDAAADGPVLITGARGAIRRRADDPRYWEARVCACDASGRPLATAHITFVAVRGAARRLVTGMLAINPPEVVRRAFPAYCPP